MYTNFTAFEKRSKKERKALNALNRQGNGLVRRTSVHKDRKKEASRKACRGKGF